MNKISFVLTFFVCINLCAYSQSDSAHLTTIATKLEKLSGTHPVEKVYLHLNKPAYNLGDTIWFKGYVTVGTHHQPSALSGVLYVELIDEEGKLLQSLQLKNNNGISVGDFILDGKIVAGDYHIRAYTTWMRNAGQDYFFNGTITVRDVEATALFINPSYTIANINNQESINTKLAFIDKQGRPFNNREVSYEVRADTNLLYKGKGSTDISGNLTFTFPGKTAPGQHINIFSHVKIVNGVIIDKTTPLNIQNENIDIQFFSEGGQLLNNVRSKVAFKAIGTNGLGVVVKGTVFDNDNNEVAEFTTQHAGMGVFALTPQSGKTYTAKITLADNLVITQKLPVALDKGFVLAVNNNDSTKLTVRVATNAATLDERKGQSFYLVGQSGGTVYYTTIGKLDNASFIASVPKNKFPSGIAQFTLFSSTNEPLNERMVFIQNNTDLLNISLSAPKMTYSSKEKISMAFNAKDNANKPVFGSFSLSVYNEDTSPVNENAECSILSNILLTSDLKGFIEQPNYYFNNQNSKTKNDLDVLMLTQGYRRFEWKEILNDNYPAITYKSERSLSLSGTLTNSSKKPVAKGKVSVLSIANKISVDTIANEQGKFTLTGFDFIDTTKLMVQARKENGDKEVTIMLDNKTVPSILKNNTESQSIDYIPLLLNKTPAAGKADTIKIGQAIKGEAFALNKNNKLKEVVIKERKNAGTELAPWVYVPTHSANLNGPGHANQVFNAKDLENCGDFLACIINKIPGIQGDREGEVFYFFRHSSQSITKPPIIRFMLNGQILNPTNDNSKQNMDELLYLDVSRVESVEVLNSVSYLSVYGTTAPGGLIIITTKIGNLDPDKNYATEVSPGVITTNFKGFNKVREFYTPKYTAKNTNIDDTRDAIYWNPNIITDAAGKYNVEFFNSDIKGTYRAVIEGIDNDGNIGRYVYRYKVE